MPMPSKTVANAPMTTAVAIQAGEGRRRRHKAEIRAVLFMDVGSFRVTPRAEAHVSRPLCVNTSSGRRSRLSPEKTAWS